MQKVLGYLLVAIAVALIAANIKAALDTRARYEEIRKRADSALQVNTERERARQQQFDEAVVQEGEVVNPPGCEISLSPQHASMGDTITATYKCDENLLALVNEWSAYWYTTQLHVMSTASTGREARVSTIGTGASSVCMKFLSGEIPDPVRRGWCAMGTVSP